MMVRNVYTVEIIYRYSNQAGKDYLVIVRRKSDMAQLRGIAHTRLGARFMAWHMTKRGFRIADRIERKANTKTEYEL